jgi:hypothetical protein
MVCHITLPKHIVEQINDSEKVTSLTNLNIRISIEILNQTLDAPNEASRTTSQTSFDR